VSERTEVVAHAHPATFGLLVIPFGLAVGYVQVAVPYLLGERHLSMAAIGLVSGMSQLPHGFKFLWAPALDAGWRRRSWYLGSIVATALCMALAALIPPDADARAGPLSLLTVFALVLTIAQAAVTTSNSAVNTLMATTIPREKKGAVAGWSMAGNLGGTGIGGALALWLAKHVSSTTTALILAAICIVCAIPVLWIHEPAPAKHPVSKLFGVLLRDIWATVKSREGWTGLVICFSPVGAGAATQLFSALSKEYLFAPGGGTSALGCFGSGPADRELCVELVNGMLGGIVGALGCLFGGYLADRVNRRLCYVLAGTATATTAVAMAFMNANPSSFTWGTLVYQFSTGICFAAFAAFVLEMVGDTAAVTTKYALFVGVSNQPISYVTWFDGMGSDWGRAHMPHDPARGARLGLLGTDALATALGIVLLGIMVVYARRAPARARVVPS
jgi:MFS family permease